MKQHEREYFVSRIRSGIYIVKNQGITLKITQPTVEQELELNEIYNEAYEQALEDDFMTEDQMLDWMREKNLWCDEDEQKFEGLKKDIERLKVEIFNARNNENLKDKIRLYLRAGEKQLVQIYSKKNSFYENTCEGIASAEKSFAFIKMCTFLGGQLYKFDTISCDIIWQSYFTQIMSENLIRDLARNEPWRTLWLMNDSNTFKLFSNDNKDLSPDQRAILIWSRTYDNVYESLECPSEDVVADDDMLDGWFIVQRKKREKQKAESELESSVKNDKIKNSDEIFIVAGSKKDAGRINEMNDINGKVIKKQRENLIKQKGSVGQGEFQDEKIKLSSQSVQMYKDKFRR